MNSLGFKFVATAGTAIQIRQHGFDVKGVNKVSEGRPHIVDQLRNKEIQLVINTPSGKNPIQDEKVIRQVANELNVPLYTTMDGALALVNALECLNTDLNVYALQTYAAHA